MKFSSLLLEMLYICLGILNSLFLCFFAWVAFLYGGPEGIVILKWNKYNELVLELVILNIIVVFLISYSIHKIKLKNKQFKTFDKIYKPIVENIEIEG